MNELKPPPGGWEGKYIIIEDDFARQAPVLLPVSLVCESLAEARKVFGVNGPPALVSHPDFAHEEVLRTLIFRGPPEDLIPRAATIYRTSALSRLRPDRARSKAAALHMLGIEGTLALQEGKLRDAADAFSRALVIARELDDPRGEAAAAGSLAMVRARERKPEDAAALFSEALRTARAHGLHREEGVTLSQFSDFLLEQGQAEEALPYLHQRLTVANENDDRHGSFMASAALGTAHLMLGDPNAALMGFHRGAQGLESLGALDEAGRAYSYLGAAWLAIERPDKTIEACQRHLQLCGRTGRYDEAGATYHNLVTALAALERKGEAAGVAEEGRQRLSRVDPETARKLRDLGKGWRSG